MGSPQTLMIFAAPSWPLPDAGAVPARLVPIGSLDLRLLCGVPLLHFAVPVTVAGSSLPGNREGAGVPVIHAGAECSWDGGRRGALYRWEPLPFILCSLLLMIFTYLTVVKVQEPEPDHDVLPPCQGIWGRLSRSFNRSGRTNPSSASWWRELLVGIHACRPAPFIMLYFIYNWALLPRSALLPGTAGITTW